MPFEIKLEQVPAGYSLTDAVKGEPIKVEYKGFYTSWDGAPFFSRMDGFPAAIISALPANLDARPSVTDDLFVILRADKTATVYYNEFAPTTTARAKGRIEKGDLLSIDSFLDIDRVHLDAYPITDECGIVHVFSAGWHKGLFFDLGPVQFGESKVRRDYDLEVTLARCRVQLWYRHLFSIPQKGWSALFQQGWFPFVHLPQTLLQRLIGVAARGGSVDSHLDEIRQHVIDRVNREIDEWASVPAIAGDLPLLRTAFERYCAGDDISASHILYPRLEGLLRTHQSIEAPGLSRKSQQLAQTGSGAGHPALSETSLILPEQFRVYLESVYFAGFDPQTPPSAASRHTVAHGVLPANLFNRKATTIAFLILLQVATVISVTQKRP